LAPSVLLVHTKTVPWLYATMPDIAQVLPTFGAS
jgi:hypothetical protein